MFHPTSKSNIESEWHIALPDTKKLYGVVVYLPIHLPGYWNVDGFLLTMKIKREV